MRRRLVEYAAPTTAKPTFFTNTSPQIIAHLGTILQRCQFIYTFHNNPDKAHEMVMKMLYQFTDEYNKLSSNEKNQVTDLIIKSIPQCDIFLLFPVIIGYSSTTTIQGIEVEKFPMRAANAINDVFNNSDEEKRRVLFQEMDRQIQRDSVNRERAQRQKSFCRKR